MLAVRHARISDIPLIKKAFRKLDIQNHYFYSEPKGSILLHVLSKNCYVMMRQGKNQGLIIINKNIKEILYYPVFNTGISFPKLIFFLKKHFSLSKYKLSLKYRKIDVKACGRYLSFKVKSDVKYMHINLLKWQSNNFTNKEELKVRQAELKRDENHRVVLQNQIFSDINGRKELTLQEVLNEENDPKFLKDLCFILEYNSIPIGYGQILLFDNCYFLVNFGIVPEYRGIGYGYYFLSQIVSSCFVYGIDELYLSVDNSNENALKLYKKIGFQEVYNSLTIEL